MPSVSTGTVTLTSWPAGWTPVASNATGVNITLDRGSGTTTASCTTYWAPIGSPLPARPPITRTQYDSLWGNASEPSPETQARQEQERRERAAATRRARDLLLAHLDDEQKQDFEENGAFNVQVGRRCYRLNQARVGNVICREPGQPRRQFCIHPVELVPSGDQMLGQKLLLETDEEAFLRIANRW